MPTIKAIKGNWPVYTAEEQTIRWKQVAEFDELNKEHLPPEGAVYCGKQIGYRLPDGSVWEMTERRRQALWERNCILGICQGPYKHQAPEYVI